MAELRKGEVTMKGNPIDLVGPKLAPGDQAPDFEMVKEDLSTFRLADTAKKIRLFSVVPSLDTPVCSLQTQHFAEKLNALGDQVEAYTISLDLPFAMKRFCGDHKITNLVNLSDAHDHSFGKQYGVLIQGLPIPLLARAIFVVDPAGIIRHTEIVPEIAQEPDYESTFSAIRSLVS